MARFPHLGKKFGKLTVVSVDRVAKKNYTYYFCRCECGGTRSVYGGNLTSGQCTSCGCAYSRPKSHGMTRTATFRIWMSMKGRCGKRKNYLHVRYCDRWNKFENFLADMGERPSKDLSLDRIDGMGDYEPENCRWATRKVQTQNRITTVWITYRAETKCLADWAAQFGLSEECIKARLARGWSLEKAFANSPYKLFRYKGKKRTIREWAQLYYVDQKNLRNRLQKGWAMHDALTTPHIRKGVRGKQRGCRNRGLRGI